MPKRHDKYNRSVRGRYRELARAARKKKVPLTISLEEYELLLDIPCEYCSGAFGKDSTGSGLDRITPPQGYQPHNVLRSCGVCNSIRGDNLTVDETKAVVALVKKMRGI